MKKYLSLFFILFLAIVLAACSNNTEPTTTDPDPTGEENNTDDNDTNEPEEEIDEDPEYNFNGLVLKYGAPWLREIDPEASEFNERWAARIEELEEKWNFELEIVEIGWDDYVRKYITTTLAGEPIADIVYMLTPHLYPNLVDNNIVYPVSDLGIIDYSDIKWKTSATDASEYKGKRYSLTYNGISTRDGIWWNKTLFKNLGLPDLYEIYESGEWTWDKLAEIADLATRDLDNDGEIDIYGFAAENLAWKFIYSNGHESIIKTDDGIEIDMEHPRVIEALEAYQKFSQEYGHTMRHWYDGANWDFRYTDFANGIIAMVSAEWWVSNSYFINNMQDDYGFVPFPTGPSNNEPVSYGYEESLDVMLATVDKPEEKVRIWDAILDIGTEEDWNEWIRSEFESTAKDAQTVEYLMMLNDRTKINLIRGFADINDIFNDLFSQIGSGQTTVQSGLEAVTPQIQAALEDFKKHGYELDTGEEEE